MLAEEIKEKEFITIKNSNHNLSEELTLKEVLKLINDFISK
ncbi:MAG: hypothetical protein PHI91_02655 [Candidatus Pacebacteria bacterium]|nr:hypothetical protein [Candidatus Paceibacterota bacterium]MDD2757408.1 hypothetical protein [Candidatus Paceibacterota bacterium]MDD3970066.1 hypothetical protein [Candidatus Paceibacterota bacterium]